MEDGRINDALDAIDALDRAGVKGPTMDYLYGMAFAAKARTYIAEQTGGAAVQMSLEDAVMFLERAVKAFCQVPPDACVLTKIDEAGRLGGLLATLIANQLPAAYVTDGQRVPEDLHLARTHTLVTRAAQLIEESTTDDGVADAHFAMALGGAVTHAHV